MWMTVQEKYAQFKVCHNLEKGGRHHLFQDMGQFCSSIKSSFVKGAGAHPQNTPCQRRNHALRRTPVDCSLMISTTLYPECRPQISHILSNLASRTHLKSSSAVQDPSSQGLARTSPYYLTIGTYDMPKPPKPMLPNQNGKVAYP